VHVKNDEPPPDSGDEESDAIIQQAQDQYEEEQAHLHPNASNDTQKPAPQQHQTQTQPDPDTSMPSNPPSTLKHQARPDQDWYNNSN
jgi:hypothetical protein